MNKLVIIDGNSLLFRAHFAMRPMVTSGGVHTQGIYAFVNMLNKIIRENEPDYLAVCFDMKAKTFRHKMYEDYKAGRQQTPIELLAQIPILHDVLDAMNIAVLELEGYEADDLIGTVTRAASEEGIQSLVITGDKDELQLIDENTRVLINKKGMSEFTIYDVDEMNERYSLTPLQFIDLKGLMGDKSDNIPGVSGIGEKKGIALLKEYGTLENVLDNADAIKGKMGETIRASKDVAVMSKELATICRNAPVEWSWDMIAYCKPDYVRLTELYTELEFRSLIKALGDEGAKAASENSRIDIDSDEYERVDFEDFVSSVGEDKAVIIDCVTDFSHTGSPIISAVALLSEECALYTYRSFSEIEASLILNTIAEAGWKLIGYDIKRLTYSALAGFGIVITPHDDICIAEYLIDPNRSKYQLSKMVHNYLGVFIDENDSKLYDEPLTDEMSDDKLFHRMCYIAMVCSAQKETLDSLSLNELYREIEMPLVETISAMESEGIKLREEVLIDIGKDIDEQIDVLDKRIHEAAGCEFNINSPKQLANVLFEQMEIPYPKAKGKSYSTAQDILDKLKDDYPIVDDVLAYRKLAKLRSTYIEGLISLKAEDGCIHPHFMQTVAATGRLSCTEPNLQNIPVRDSYGRLIRKAFEVREPGNVFIGSDYSQIELRIMAALSGDENLIDAFEKGEDIHRATASRVFGIPMGEVNKEDRSKAKAVNFGVIYGMSGFGLSENLNVTRAQAQKYISDYFAKHQAVKEFLDRCVQTGETERAVRTYFGRIRQIPEFASRKFMDRELAKRLAMNTPIQGTAADIIKIAMNSVYQRLKNGGYKSKLILQIHDELIVEAPSCEAEEVTCLIRECMENACSLGVKLLCDINTSDNWYDLK